MINLIIKMDEKKLKKYKIYYDKVGDLPLIKGFYEPNKDKIYINLSSLPFLINCYLEDHDSFVEEISKTITHEITHQEINRLGLNTNDESEEYICRLMAGQEC
jgi:hypothetical protein